MSIFPKNIDFFQIFDKAVDNLSKGTGLLVSLMEDFTDVEGKVKQIYEIEQEGDILTHDIMRKLNQTFITPIDREDIQSLAANLDDILDHIWAAVDKLIVFKIEEPTPDSVHLVKELHQTSEVIQKAIRELRLKDYDHVKEHCIEINRMENRIDRTYRNSLGELFDDYRDDPVMIIKWKDIYEHFEDAADKCEDVANILETIVLKHA
jgi:predicted phosphate transport protein (TIGR00153 family)